MIKNQRSAEQYISVIVISALALLVLYLFWVAWHLQIDYHDSYFILMNARSVATNNALGYTGYRPVILPILLAPILFLENFGFASLTIFALCHTFMIIAYGLLIWVTYRLFRLTFEKTISLITTLLFSLNFLLIYSAPHVKEDVIGLLFLSASFYFFLRTESGQPKAANLIFCGILSGLAIGTRFNYPLLFLVPGIYLVWGGIKSSSFAKFRPGKIFFVFAFPVIIFCLILSFHYQALKIAPFFGSISHYISGPLKTMSDIVKSEHYVTPLKCIYFLIKASTWPVMVCAVAGFFLIRRKKKVFGDFYLVWFLVFFIYATFLINHKEARFLIPILPPLYFFVAAGLEFLIAQFTQRKLWRTISASIALLLLLVIPVKAALDECFHFQDPIYRVDFSNRLFNHAHQLAGEHAVYWIGPFYPVHPKKYIFDPEDVTTYIYHIFANTYAFHTKSYNIRNLKDAQFREPDGPNQPIWVGPNIGPAVNDGDVLIVNRELDSYNTMTLPPTIKPLVVQQVRKLYFDRQPDTQKQSEIFRSLPDGSAHITFNNDANGFSVSGGGLTPRLYELYADFEGVPTSVSLGFSEAKNGKIELANGDVKSLPAVKRLYLLYFDSVQEYRLPE